MLALQRDTVDSGAGGGVLVILDALRIIIASSRELYIISDLLSTCYACC